ncbi:MAG: hypothetical protein ABR584_02640 [Candidatus Baltobacteraceae bacterium]
MLLLAAVLALATPTPTASPPMRLTMTWLHHAYTLAFDSTGKASRSIDSRAIPGDVPIAPSLLQHAQDAARETLARIKKEGRLPMPGCICDFYGRWFFEHPRFALEYDGRSTWTDCGCMDYLGGYGAPALKRAFGMLYPFLGGDRPVDQIAVVHAGRIYRALLKPDGTIRRTIDGIETTGPDYHLDRRALQRLFAQLGGDSARYPTFALCKDAKDGDFVPDEYYVQYDAKIAQGNDDCLKPAVYSKSLQEIKRVVAEIFILNWP